MEVLNNYLEYRKYKPEYKAWKQKRDEKASKKEQYFKTNPLPEAEKQRQLQKIKVVLNAVDTMDDASQKKAENAEVATQAVQGMVSQISAYAGMALGFALILSKAGAALKGKIALKHPNIANNFETFAIMAGMVLPLFLSGPMILWGAKNEIFASKIGRHEAVKGQLNSLNQFAVLDENQINEVKNKAQSVEIQDEGIVKKAGTSFNEAISTVKNLFSQNEEVKQYLEEENEKFEAHKANFDKPLSEKGIQNAKEEQELITRIVEEIDTASQDYAEDVELATGSLIISSTAIGALAGFVLNKIGNVIRKIAPKNVKKYFADAIAKMPKLKATGKLAKALPVITGVAGMLAASIASAKLQKQASRVARFTVMKDLENNPERLMYVDDEKLKDIEPEVKKKKENLFKFYKRLFKENKEYNNYLKENEKRDKQYRIALNEIKLSDKQKADAKQLQSNVFKAFNRIDDKSQKYSENTEAFGELIKTYGSTLFMLGGLLMTTFSLSKKNAGNSTKDFIKAMLPTYLGIIPAIGLEFFVTKEQKGASRVAHMLAIKDLEDVKHFVDYENLENKPGNSLEKDKTKELAKEPASNFKADSLNVFAKFGFKG